MAMMYCPECGKEISSSATQCPHCGFSLQKKKKGGVLKKILIGVLIAFVALLVIAVLMPEPGVTPEFKEAMDSYESFFDEYAEVMQSYSADPLGMMTKYTSILTQYTDTVSKLQNIDTSKLSQADRKYYIEVTERIEKKLAGINGNEANKDSAPETETKNTESEKSSDSASVAESKAEEKQAGSDAAGVAPDLKEFLDSYEAFTDEYVDFMKKYMENPGNAVSLLSEYTEIMKRYDDFAKKVGQYDTKTMSAEDAKYYLEVTNRCTQKMLDIY